jgi:hypothetical protein
VQFGINAKKGVRGKIRGKAPINTVGKIAKAYPEFAKKSEEKRAK